LAGFYFSLPNSVQHRPLSLPLVNTRFKIPANDSNYEADATLQVPFFMSGKAVLMMPHMHLLGRKVSATLTDPSGTVKASGAHRRLGFQLAGLLYVHRTGDMGRGDHRRDVHRHWRGLCSTTNP
jgi:hypothetical protein